MLAVGPKSRCAPPLIAMNRAPLTDQYAREMASIHASACMRVFVVNRPSIARTRSMVFRFRSSIEYEYPGARPAMVVTNIHTRSEEHTSELQSLMRTSYDVFCLHK